MESSAYKWLVSQYRFVLNRMRAHEFMEEHPSCAAASRPRSAAAFIAPRLRLEQLENRVMLATNVTGIPNWAEQGPGPMTSGQVRGIANQPVTGAIHSVAADPDVAQAGTIWVGTVGGGIWKTTNGGTTWTPKTDQFPSTAISAIALDPVNNNVVWAGTGKVSSSGLGGKTIGLLKSSDGGETWKIFPSIFERNRTIHAIVPTTVAQGSGRVVLIGSDATPQFTGAPAARVSGGLVRSTDGGFGGFKKISGNHNDGLDNDSDGTKDEADENTGLPGGTVTDIKGDPTDPNRFYAAMPGIGIFMSIDAGATWTQLNTALGTAGANVTASTKIELAVSSATAANGNHPIYAAMIQEVQDNLIGARPAPNQVDVSLNTLITNGDTVWIYNAAGQAIDNRQVIATATVGGNTRLTFASNLTVAHTPGAFIWRGGMRIAGMFRSDDHGATWRSMGRPGDANGGIHPGAQAENHLSIIADRNNANIVYVGGDRQVALPGADGVLNTPDDTFGAGNAAGATNYTGRLFRGTFAPGPNTTAWGSITDNNATGGGAPAAATGPHADSRAMVYDANGDILEVDDGGIYKLVNPGANQIWQSINGNLRLTEFYSVAWNATTSQILGGTQDNGVAYQSGPNNLSWGNLSQGDGAIVASSNGVNYYSSQNFGGFKIGAASPALRVAGTGPAASRMALGKFDTTVQFVQPYVVNAAANNRVLIGTSYLYETNAVGSNLGDLLTPLGGNPLATGATFAPNPTAFIGKVRPNAMVYGGFQGATPMPDVGWVGTDGDAASNFLFIRQAGANTPFVPVVSWRSAVAGQKAPNTRIVAVAVDPTDWRHVYVLDASGRIWFSDDGAKNPALQMDNSTAANWQWTELTKQTNNLLTLPGATNLQDIAIHRTATRRVILVGGDGGLFRRVDNLTLPANGNWHEYGGGPTVNGVATPNGGGLPNAMVSDIEFTTNNQVLVGTMGRGAFTAPTADLINPGLVSITGTAGADVLKLRRDAARPWLLNIYEYLVGNAEPAAATTVVPLASINSILIDGGAGNDQIVVDYSNGAISVPDGITVVGGDDTDSLSLPVPTVARRKATSKKTSNLGPLFQSTITSKDSFGVEGKQMVFWSTLNVETPPGATQIASAINTVGSGLQTASNSLQHGLGSVAGGTALAGLNAQSLTAGLNGVRINQPRPKDDAFLSVSEVNDSDKVQLDNATSVLRRLIEEGLNGFHLNDIDEEEGTITDLDALKDALDALDGTAGNVTLNTTTNDNDGDGTMDPTFTVQILNRPLDGIVNLDVNAMSALGEIQLGGALEVTADVTLNVVFGVDAEGFFLKPSAAGTPAIRLSNFEIDGAVSGKGRLGFLGVELKDATLTVDPAVGIEFSFTDPGTGVDADSNIRLTELEPAEFSDLIDINIDNNPGGPADVVLDGTFGVSALVPGTASGITLLDGDVKLSWADLGDPTTVALSATPGSAGSKFFDFMKVTGQQVLDQLKALRGYVDTLTAAGLNTGMPLLKDGLSTIINVVEAIDAKLINPLSGGGGIDTGFHTAQELAVMLAGELGLDLSDVNLQYNSTNGELTWHIDFSHAFASGSHALAFEIGVQDGLAINADFTGAVDAHFGFAFDMGVDIGGLVGGGGIADNIFIRNASLDAGVDINITDFDVDGRLGFLKVQVVNGTVLANPNMTMLLNDPGTNSDAASTGRIDLSELVGSPAAVISTPSLTGSINLSLPLAAPFLGIDPFDDGAGDPNNDDTSTTVGVTINLSAGAGGFSVTLPTGIDFTEMFNFTNIDAASMTGLLGKLTFWLDEFRRSDEFKKLDLPLIGPALDKVLGFADAFRDRILIDDNDDALDGPTTLLHDLNTALAQAGLADKVRAENVGGKIKLILNDAGINQFSITSAPTLGFGAQTSSGTDNFESILAASAAPANGKLSGDATFTLSFDGGPGVEVRLYKTSGPAPFDGAAAVVAATDRLTVAGHLLNTGDVVKYDAGGGTVVPGLSNGGTYYVIKIDGNTLQLASTLANATAGTPVPVNITGVGAGALHTLAHPYNTDDNTAIGNDKWKLVNADNAATFATVQELILKLNEIFGSNTLAYDQIKDTLTFSLNLNETFGTLDLPVNFNFDDLEPLLGLQSSGNIRLSADGTLNLTVGVFLGAAPSSTKLDGTEALNALNEGVHVKTEQLITGVQDVKQEYGRLSGDATFKLFVNGSATGTDVIVTKTSTDTNTTVADLVADVTAALTTAALNTQVQAVFDGLKVVLKGIGATTALKLTAENTNPAVRDLGFSADQTAAAVDGVLKIIARDQLPFAVGRLAGDATFQFSLNTFESGAVKTVVISQADTQNNRNLLDVISDVQKAIDAVIPPIPAVPATLTEPEIPAKSRIKVASSGRRLTFTAIDAGVTSFSITAVATNPAVTVFGLAANNVGNSYEFFIITRNGTRHGITLDGITDLNGVMAAIESQTGGAVQVEIDAKQLGLKLTDTTLSGTEMFRVETANGTTAAIDLGILKQDAPTPIPGADNEAPDHVIDGSAIGGIRLTDRFFIQTADINVGLHMSTPTPLEATAKFGFVGVELDGGGNINATFNMGLKNPDPATPNDPITLTQLMSSLSNITSIVKNPTLTGGGSIALDVSVNPTLPGLNLGSNPQIVFNVVDLGNPFTGDLPTVNLTFPDLGDLVDFGNLDFDFQTIIEGLKTLASFLQEFETFGFLSEPLPLVNVSVTDLIDIADKFAQAIDEAEANPAGTVQLLENKIKEAFGIPLSGPGSDLFQLVLVNDDNDTASTSDDFQILKMELSVSASFAESLNLDFDLGSALSLGGAADLSATGSLDLQLDVGLRLDDPTQIYVFDTTGLNGSLNINGANLSFNAAAGPLGVFVNGGHADIHGTVDHDSNAATPPKLFAADLSGATFVNGRTLVSDLDLSDAFSASVGAVVDVDLPVYFPTASTRAGTVHFDAIIGYDTNTDAFTFSATPTATDENDLPLSNVGELFLFDPTQISILDGLLLGVDGVDMFLDGLQDLLDGDLFSFDLPLIGDKLSDAADMIGDFRDGFITDFRAAIESLANPAAAFNAVTGGQPDPVSKILFQLLGGTGLGLLKDGPDAGTDITVADIKFTTNINDAGVAPEDLFFDWDFALGDTIDASAGIGFDVGIPGLGLETTGAVAFALDWKLALGFGINFDDGFYFDIANKDALGVKHPELEVKADVTVPGGSIKGTLGFLQLSATDNPNGDATATHLGATFGVDIINRNNLGDEKLSFTELGRIGVTAGLAAEAVVDLGAKLALSSDLIPNAATNFPSIVADFRLEWALGNRAAGTLVNLEDLSGGFLENGLKFVGFEHVGLDLGSYFSDLIEPIVKKVQEITNPIKPFLDFLTTPIPVISDLAGPTTLLDIAALSGAINPGIITAIEVIDEVVDIASSLSGISGPNLILYFDEIFPDGTFVIYDAEAAGAGDAALPNLNDPNIDLSGLASNLDWLPGQLGDALTAVSDAVENAAKKMLPGGSASSGFKLPIIDDPSQIFGMLLGTPAVLVEYDMAPLGVKADFSAFFSIFGPLGVSINAEFEALIDFSFGYDTQGAQDFAASDFRNPALLFNGFFVGDMDATGKVDVAELQFDAGLWAAAELNLGIARGGVGGGLFAEIDFNLHDPNHDGRIRLSELATNFLNELEYGEPILSPLAIFDVTGSLTAKLFAFLKIDLGLFSLDKKFDITPPLELLNFNLPFTRVPTLASDVGGGVLQLNMGQFAAERVEGDKTDGDETFTVTGNASELFVTAFGFTQRYTTSGGWKKILALGGEGNDAIDLSGVSGNIGAELEGNAGNDTIKAGATATGAGKILGGAGNDSIWGSNGQDVIFGEAGDDQIHGGGNTDWLFGDGSVKDSIQGTTIAVEPKLNDGNDSIYGDAGDDLLFGAGGADSLEGGADADALIGDGGKVTVNASKVVTHVEDTDGSKGGNDSIKGDAGADVIYGGTGVDSIQGGSENDKIYGESGADSITGEAGNDTVYAGTQSDNVDGGAGADSIFGEDGHDTVAGGTENDWISGGTGNDLLAGGGGNDTVFGNSDLDTITGDAGDDFLEGGHGNDTTTGGIGNDTLVGGYGSDILDGQSGNDSYNIAARGGATTELTTSYDTGGLSDTDVLTVDGTGDADTFLLRGMSDAYFPSLNDLDHLISKILKSGKAEKLDLLKEGITNRYGVHGVPDGMLDAVEDAFDANPIDGSSLASLEATTNAVIAAVNTAIAGDYIQETQALVHKRIENIFTANAAADAAAKFALISQAITDLYSPHVVPAGMLAAVEDALEADATDLDAANAAFDAHYVNDLALGQDTAFVALINDGGAKVERFNYRNMEGLVLNTLHGNDYVASDDVMASTTINLGLGADRVQIGQVYASPRTDNPLTANITPDDVFATVAITRGFLSAGVSRPTVINGGDGNDEMTVFHNTAVVNLNGGDGDDLFTVRAFALAGSTDSERARTDMKGDGGADTIRYALNAPVGIDGGDGFDTIRVVGTEFSDDFVVTDTGVYGAGLNISYVNIEKLVADGAEGNDRFFVLSTGLNVVTEIDGGLGSDSFFVGGAPGNAPIPVISDDFKGHSGIILNNVESTDPAWQNVKAEGVSANIADNEEPFLIVSESGGASSVTEDALSGGIGVQFDTYKIRLSRKPQPGKHVLVKLVDSGLPPEDQAKKYKDLEFWDPSSASWVTAQNHPGLLFTSSNDDWKNGLEVKFRAAHDDASEGQRFTFINHITENSTDDDFAGVQLLSVKVGINDDDRAGVVISSVNNNTTVLENGFTDQIKVVLTRQPTSDVIVTLASTNGQIGLSDTSLLFTTSNWNTPQPVTITATNDAVIEGFHTDFITATVSSSDVDTHKTRALATVDADLLLPGVQPIVPEKATSFLFLEHKPDLTQPITIKLDAGIVQPLADGEITPELRYTITGNTVTFIKNGNAVAVSGTVQAAYKYIERGYDNILVKDTSVDIYDNDAAMVIVTQSDGSTDVLEGGYTDKYTVVLSKAPAAGTTVTINVDAIKTRTTLEGDAEFKEQVTVNGASATTITFTDANWNVPQEVTVEAIDDNFQDGSETQVFAPELNTVNKIRGPLIIEGAAGAGSLSLPAPLMLPGELNVRASHGNVVAFTPGAGGGAIETMTVNTQDLLDHLADVDVDTITKLLGKTIELTKGPGTDVVLDATRPRDIYDRFWLITEIVDLGGGLTQLRLQNPTAVDPGQPNVTAPTTATEYAITSLSVNFFADERVQVDYTTVFDQDSVANDTGTMTSSDGNVLGFTASAGTTETMTVETTDLQALGLTNNDLNNLVGKVLEITIGPGKGRKWQVESVANTTDSTVKLLTLTKLSGGSGAPTNRSEFRFDGFDRHGRILGLGMGPNVVIGSGVQPGGITYGDMEVLQVNLGNGNDTLDVDYTTNAEGHTTKRSGDFYTLTMLNLGAGNDTVNAKIDAAQDGDLAIRGQAGNDTINATGSTLGIVAFGEEGNDSITGGDGQDSLFGDFGRVDFVDAQGKIVTRLGHSTPLNPVNPPVVSATANTITDPTANFTTEYGGLVGLMVQVIMPDGHVQFRRIIANTATTITVDSNWTTMPVTGQLEVDENSAYRISALPEDQGDGTYRGPRIVWSIDNAIGGNDVINGGGGKDLLIGGAANDVIDAGAGEDIVAGDSARVDFTPITGTDGPTKVVKITETGAGVGGNDSISGGADGDVVIAGLGNDTVNGQAGGDVLIGDRADVIYKSDGVTIDSIETTDRANGGNDRIYGNEGDDVVIGGTGADALDGGSEKDLVFGDNVRLVNNVGSADAIKGRFRTALGATLYNAAGQPNVGAPSNLIPGGLPTWADWTITLDQTLTNFGNDYIAGGAGDDEIFGQLGNDTVQGDGSIDITVSATQASVEAATDGDDYIEGNDGSDLIFGNLGQDDLIGGSSNLFSLTTPALRGDGADIIFGGAGTDLARNHLGDTGNTAHSRDADFIIGDNGNIYRLVDAAGNARTFTYDNYGPLKLIPRSVQHLDYTYGGNAATDIGAADLIHGESGDDSVYGTVGNDVLFGEGQDDDIFGGIGHDRIYAGSGEDGVVGDDGLIFTSRNGLTETLHGVNTASVMSNLAMPGPWTAVWINITGRIQKDVQLLAYEIGGNDVVYGGLGDDFLHAGAGNDAVSGAEALATFYTDAPVTNTTPIVYDPATRKLAGYDANKPLVKVANFLLNFDASVGGVKIDDGKDRIFGDTGHDWIVGGTGTDRLFGGAGDDMIDADDNKDTAGGLNSQPDAPLYADADWVYGGDGLDVMIANTGGERMFDWGGEFNTYVVPYSPFGEPTVARKISPGMVEFLLALGLESGADATRLEPDGELGLFTAKDPQWQANHGGPRDPQGPNAKAKRDTQGGPEDQRNTALPL